MRLKSLLVNIILICPVILVNMGCKTIKISEVKTGWINNNKLSAYGSAIPGRNIKDPLLRKKSSKQLAVLSAQYHIIESFDRLCSYNKLEMGQTYRNFKSIVKGGKIDKITFDKDQGCELIYVIESQNLKERVKNFRPRPNLSVNEKDKKELLKLMDSIEMVFKKAESDYKAGKKENAIAGFIEVARISNSILYQYETLGYSHYNKQFKSPTYLLYQLVSHLEERKDFKMKDGSILNKPTNEGATIILGYTGKDTRDIDYKKIDAENFYKSASRIKEYIKKKILSQREVVAP